MGTRLTAVGLLLAAARAIRQPNCARNSLTDTVG